MLYQSLPEHYPTMSSPPNPFALRARRAIQKHSKEHHLSTSSQLPELKNLIDLDKLSIGPNDNPVCIIGAGVAGLYTALILESLKIPYKLLEMSDRVGGTSLYV